MIIFLLIILIGGIAGLYLYYDNKIMMLKRQILTLTSQYTKLKEKTSTSLSSKNLTATFITPSITTSSISINSNIHLAPVIDSPILQKITEVITVEILDSVKIDNSLWFYVSLPNCIINNRGWVLEKDLLL